MVSAVGAVTTLRVCDCGGRGTGCYMPNVIGLRVHGAAQQQPKSREDQSTHRYGFRSSSACALAPSSAVPDSGPLSLPPSDPPLTHRPASSWGFIGWPARPQPPCLPLYYFIVLGPHNTYSACLCVLSPSCCCRLLLLVWTSSSHHHHQEDGAFSLLTFLLHTQTPPGGPHHHNRLLPSAPHSSITTACCP